LAAEQDPLVILDLWVFKGCKDLRVFKGSRALLVQQVIKVLQVRVVALRDPQV
jgi:hypothetical protein